MLKAELANDQARLNEVQTTSAQTDKYLALARKYRDCTEVTDDMILAFVEKIVVYRRIITTTPVRIILSGIFCFSGIVVQNLSYSVFLCR